MEINDIRGMHIQENSILTDTLLIRMCRSKRKRIVKKWLKNKRNYKTVPSQKVLIFADPRLGQRVIVCHPMVAARIREAIQEAEIEKQNRIITHDYFKNIPTLQDRYQLAHNYKNFS